MHDHALVRCLQRTCDLQRIGDRARDLERAFATDHILERLPLDVLEHDVGGALGRAATVGRQLLPGVDHGHDVGMVELRDRAGLAPEALQLVCVGGDLAVHQLDRDGPLEHGVEGAIDRRHSAAADLGIESVAAAEERPHEAHRPYCARFGADRWRVAHEREALWSVAPETAASCARRRVARPASARR